LHYHPNKSATLKYARQEIERIWEWHVWKVRKRNSRRPRLLIYTSLPSWRNGISHKSTVQFQLYEGKKLLLNDQQSTIPTIFSSAWEASQIPIDTIIEKYFGQKFISSKIAEPNANLSLPSTLQYTDGPGHYITWQKKTSSPK
jgi:hypothetical protein